MNDLTRTQTSRTSAKARMAALAALASISFLFSGCLGGESSGTGDPSGNETVTVEGRVQGDAELGADGGVGALGKRASSSGGVAAAAVTVMRIKADGSLEAVSAAEVKTDAQGRFSVKAAVSSSSTGPASGSWYGGKGSQDVEGRGQRQGEAGRYRRLPPAYPGIHRGSGGAGQGPGAIRVR